jgi:membrane protein
MAIRKFAQTFVTKFFNDETTTLAASLAFYTALSLAPLVILFVTITAQISPELQQNFLSEARNVVGSEAAKTFEIVIDGARERPDLSSTAGFFGVATLLFSAGLIFGELRGALNRIFAVKPSPDLNPSYLHIVGRFLRTRVLQIGVALSFIFVLIVSLIVSSIITSLTSYEHVSFVRTLNIGVTFVFYGLLFALTFRYLPDRRQPWRRALSGGFLTAGLFVLGKELIALYLGRSAIGSAYGAAGSLIVLLVWVYYSTLITFIGAQVSSLIQGKPNGHRKAYRASQRQ